MSSAPERASRSAASGAGEPSPRSEGRRRRAEPKPDCPGARRAGKRLNRAAEQPAAASSSPAARSGFSARPAAMRIMPAAIGSHSAARIPFGSPAHSRAAAAPASAASPIFQTEAFSPPSRSASVTITPSSSRSSRKNPSCFHGEIIATRALFFAVDCAREKR